MQGMKLILLLLTARLTTACQLCFDGEEITKPDFALDVTEPVRIKTCQDLVNLVVFFPEDDDICSDARVLSTLCGCPNRPPNACTICGGDSMIMTKPLQNLDGLVDLGGVDFLGLSPTCALVESATNNLNRNDQDCSDLPMDELQLYCGCLSTEDEGGDDDSTTTTCTLCPGGEIVPDLPAGNNSLSLMLNSNETRISCSDAHRLVKEEESGSVLCSDIQRGSTACGCPVPENACKLCPDDSKITSKNATVDSIFGIRQECSSFSHQLHRYDRESAECQSLDETSYHETCGCQKNPEFVPPCTLCPGGVPAAYPDKVIFGLDGFGLEHIEPTCGSFEQAMLSGVVEDARTCQAARLFAKLCGCPVPETSCSICETGTSLTNPFGEYRWAFGSLNESDAFPQFSSSIDVNDQEFSCEIVDSFLSEAYDSSHDYCYFNQLLRGSSCGCRGSNHTKVVALVWTQRCSGLLSLMGSLAIIVLVLTKKTKNRWNTYNQLVLSISILDGLSSISYIFGTALTPADLGIHGSIGNEGTCKFQGWLFQMGITSMYYNVVLCVYYLLVVKYNWRESKFKKVRRWVHLGVLVVGITMSLAVIPFVTADWRWCYLNTPPYYESWLPGIFFYILPIGVCMICMTVLMILFVMYVRETENTGRRRLMARMDGPRRRSLASRTFWQSLYFLLAFYAVWPIQFVAFLVPLVEENYWIYLLAALLGPLQGFLNAMVVFYRDRTLLRASALCAICSLIQKKKTSSQITVDSQSNKTFLRWFERRVVASRMNGSNLSGEEVEESNGGRNQPSNLSHGNAEQSSPERSSRIKSTMAANDCHEASVDNPEVFEEGEAILEFAMNAGLLDDKENALYRDTICVLESTASD